MKRVAVTTTPDNFRRVANPLAEVGLEPIQLPCIRVVPSPDDVLDELRRATEQADWLIVTSARAIRTVWPDGGIPPGVRVAAVGPATADAARAAGGDVRVIGSGGTTALRAALRGRLPGQKVVFPHARSADPGTIRQLRREAASVVAEPAYTTHPIAPSNDPVDAVVFGSPSAVDGWASGRAFAGTVIAALGSTTATRVRELGAFVDVVSDPPDLTTLAGGLAAHFEPRSQPQ